MKLDIQEYAESLGVDIDKVIVEKSELYGNIYAIYFNTQEDLNYIKLDGTYEEGSLYCFKVKNFF